MVIKDAKKHNSEGTVQKKNNAKKSIRNPLVIIDDDDAQFDLPTTVERGKKKRTIEGDRSNPKKKKKKKLDSKLKNAAFADLPVIIQSSSDLESIKEAEKPPKALKKKREQGHLCKRESSPEIPSQGQITECMEANFLVAKTCKRSVLEPCAGNSGHSTKRKKKQHTLACSLIQSHAEDDYSKKDLPPTMRMISQQTMLSDRKPTLIQDAVSKGKSKYICCLTSADSLETRNGILEKGTTNPTHTLQEENNCKQDHKDVAHISKKKRQRTEQEGKKKWKKKKKLKEEVDFLLEWAGKQENHPAISTETPKSEEKMKKTDLIQNSEVESKGHKKKKSHTKVANNYPDLAEENKDAFDWAGKAAAIKKAQKKARKAKKKGKKERDPGVKFESSTFLEDSSKRCSATKRKAQKTGGAEGAPTSKQAKLKKEEKEREEEIQVISIKKGNCDEVKIDKLRRQALQEDIDRESGRTKAIKEKNELDHHFGQWSTATFESAERKTKFLRLLGGFKKGPALTQELPAQTTKHNMALARRDEEKLQQTLQTEFEKAMDWKQWRGSGLGFQPAPQKQVYIDKYASKSVKFED